MSNQGTSMGMPCCFAARLSSVKYGRYFGRFHGSIAPSLSVFDLSGMMRSRSKSIVLPNPWQRGHAPYGLLKENRRGSGSRYARWQLEHSNAAEKRDATAAPSPS